MINEQELAGISPLRLYFASVGGMVGLGNIVMVMSAVLIGGPGSLFWLWISSLCGIIIKYSETFLGIKYRVKNSSGGFDGGPMYFLAKAFSGSTGNFLLKLPIPNAFQPHSRFIFPSPKTLCSD